MVRTSACRTLVRWAKGGSNFYCTIVDRQIVVLHQFVKKTEKTPTKELAIARRRMKEMKNG